MLSVVTVLSQPVNGSMSVRSARFFFIKTDKRQKRNFASYNTASNASNFARDRLHSVSKTRFAFPIVHILMFHNVVFNKFILPLIILRILYGTGSSLKMF